MKIITVNSKRNIKTLKDVKIGEVFEFPGYEDSNEFFMKMKSEHGKFIVNLTNYSIIGADLFDDTEKVVIVNSTLHIER